MLQRALAAGQSKREETTLRMKDDVCGFRGTKLAVLVEPRASPRFHSSSVLMTSWGGGGQESAAADSRACLQP